MRLHLAILCIGLLVPGAFAQTRGHNAQLITPGSTPYLGIGARDIDSDSARKFNLKELRGAEVTTVTPDSPAAKAGIREGDVILEFNGQPIEGGEQLGRMVRETPIGRQVKIGVWRNGSMVTLTTTIEAHKGPMMVYRGPGAVPDPEQFRDLEEQLRNFRMPEMPSFTLNAPSPMLGILGEPLGTEKQLAEFFGVEEGVLVKSVNRGSAAEKAGIKAGDVIVKVDDAKVATSREISSALRAARNKKTVTVIVVRNKKETPITVTLESAATGGVGSPVRAQLWVPVEIPVLQFLP